MRIKNYIAFNYGNPKFYPGKFCSINKLRIFGIIDTFMIGNKLKKILEYKKVSSVQLAEMTGKSKGYISKILSGENDNPTKEFFDRLKQAFPELNINWLLTGEGPMFLEECPKPQEEKEPSEEEKREFVKKCLKEQFDISEKNYELFIDALINNQEIAIIFLKALKGDATAKQIVKNMFDD